MAWEGEHQRKSVCVVGMREEGIRCPVCLPQVFGLGRWHEEGGGVSLGK